VSSLKCNKILLAQGTLDRCQLVPASAAKMFPVVEHTSTEAKVRNLNPGFKSCKATCLHCSCPGKHLHFLHAEVASNTAAQTSKYLLKALAPGSANELRLCTNKQDTHV